MQLPKLNVTDVLIDVDDTITYSKTKECGGGGFLRILVDLVAAQAAISKEEALSKIREVGDTETTCLFSFLPALDVSPETYWEKIQEWLSKCLGIYKDAVVLIRSLHKTGIRFYSATTNSRMTTLSKLAVAGMAEMKGSPYFTGFFWRRRVWRPAWQILSEIFPFNLKKSTS